MGLKEVKKISDLFFMESSISFMFYLGISLSLSLNLSLSLSLNLSLSLIGYNKVQTET